MPKAARPGREAERRFWYVDPMAGTLKSGMWWLRAADEKWYWRIKPRLTRGRRIPIGQWPKPAPIFTYAEVGSRPDVATTMGEPIRVVSTELRRLIESIDPQAAQFLPVDIQGPRRRTIAEEYWLVNWLRVWDCLSSTEAMSLDPGRIPESEHIGVVRLTQRGLEGAIVCDSELKKLATASGIVGLKYNPAPIASGPLGKGHYYDPSRKRISIERRCLPGDFHFEVDEFLRRFPDTSFPDQHEGCNALYDYMLSHQGSDFSLNTLRKLLEAGYSPNTTSTISSPIPVFFHPRSPAVLRLLHEHGVDWNRPNMIGITPLMSAATYGEAEAIRLMLEFGADPHARSDWGATALHHAAEGASPSCSWPAKGYLDTIRMLLEAGVDPSITDCQGKTAADRAAEEGTDAPAAQRRWRKFAHALAAPGRDPNRV